MKKCAQNVVVIDPTVKLINSGHFVFIFYPALWFSGVFIYMIQFPMLGMVYDWSQGVGKHPWKLHLGRLCGQSVVPGYSGDSGDKFWCILESASIYKVKQ